MAHTNSKLEIGQRLKINMDHINSLYEFDVGYRELSWPKLIGHFSELTIESKAVHLSLKNQGPHAFATYSEKNSYTSYTHILSLT